MTDIVFVTLIFVLFFSFCVKFDDETFTWIIPQHENLEHLEFVSVLEKYNESIKLRLCYNSTVMFEKSKSEVIRITYKLCTMRTCLQINTFPHAYCRA